jgi:hypothetical protein
MVLNSGGFHLYFSHVISSTSVQQCKSEKESTPVFVAKASPSKCYTPKQSQFAIHQYLNTSHPFNIVSSITAIKCSAKPAGAKRRVSGGNPPPLKACRQFPGLTRSRSVRNRYLFILGVRAGLGIGDQAQLLANPWCDARQVPALCRRNTRLRHKFYFPCQFYRNPYKLPVQYIPL